MSQKSKSLKRLRDLNDIELDKESGAMRQEVWKLRLQKATGQAADSTKLALRRKDLARALTLIGQRKTAAER